MPPSLSSPAAPFGKILTAMVTPFTESGAVDFRAMQRVADHLVKNGSDGVVVNGTTGEMSTLSQTEAGLALSAVLEAVGDRATVVAGVGTNDTRHSIELMTAARKLGAHGALVVTPYYNKPSQDGIVRHVAEIARASEGLPTMLYDIPGRTGVRLEESTYVQIAEIPTVVAVKDAVGDLDRGVWLMRETGIRVYSGEDALNFHWMCAGASGAVSVVSHLAGIEYRDMLRAVERSDLASARQINLGLLGLVRAIMVQTQGAVAVKSALWMQGLIPTPAVRLPLTVASAEQLEVIRASLVAVGKLAPAAD